METNNKLPLYATHPCEVLKDEILFRGISKKDFAKRIGMQQSNLSRLLRGDTSITLPLAAKLEEALDIPASFWLDMQAKFNADKKLIMERDINEQKAIQEERILSEMLNLPNIFKRLGINTSSFVRDKLQQLKHALGFDPLDGIKQQINLYGAFKKSAAKTDDRNLRTWILLAYAASLHNKPTKSYVVGNGEKAATEISELVHSNNFTEKQINDILNKYGISYSVVEKLEKTPIDGFSTWVNDYPTIVTTHRYNDMSRLVFDILHELGHIEKHLQDKKDTIFVTNGETFASFDDREKEANRFAEEHLIADDKWMSLMQRSIKGLYSNNIVAALRKGAKELGLNPNIVLWRYRYETNNYALQGVKTTPIK